MPSDKRRTDRIMLTVPLQVYGTEPSGVAFADEARSVSLNRHGARIHTERPLRVGQVVRLVNKLTNRKADFRVVGPVAPRTDQGGEWGVELLSTAENIWGIQFPPAVEGEPGASRALLECRHCRTVTVLPISLVELEVLETAGIILRHCEQCVGSSIWGYAEKELTMGAPPEETAMLAEAQASLEGAGRTERRKHRRVSLQLPILIRDYYGGIEIAKSENLSKGGFCFASDKTYHLGQGLMVVCPYNSGSGQNIEVRSRIVHRRQLEAVQRKLYGIRYDCLGPGPVGDAQRPK